MIDLIFGYILDNVQSSSNMKFCTNQSIGSAVIGPGLFEIFIAYLFTFREDLTGNSTGYNSVNFKDRDLKLVLNERARKYYLNMTINHRGHEPMTSSPGCPKVTYFSEGPHWKFIRL